MLVGCTAALGEEVGAIRKGGRGGKGPSVGPVSGKAKQLGRNQRGKILRTDLEKYAHVTQSDRSPFSGRAERLFDCAVESGRLIEALRM